MRSHDDAPGERPPGIADDTLACLAFYSRLPVARWQSVAVPLATACRAAPLAGLVVGTIGGGALWVASLLGADGLLAAAFGVLATIAVSGALHEDGLADMADASGASSRESRLEILRDSRIGTFGTVAVVFSILLRVAALAEVAGGVGPVAAGAALAAAAAVSRSASLWPLFRLSPAREDGLGFGFGRPEKSRLRTAFLLSALLAVLLVGIGNPLGAVAGLLAAAGAAHLVVRFAQRLIGGHTGDVAGAACQAAEIAFLVALAMLSNSTATVDFLQSPS